MAGLAEQIRAEFEADERNPALAVRPGDIPINYDRITPEWLTHVLCKDHPHAAVTSHRLDEPDDGTGNRRRIFLTYNGAGSDARLPSAIFCKASEKLVNRIVMGTCGLIAGETAFYNEFSPLLDIEAPHCFLATYNPRSFNSIIVLEDLSLRGASFCDHRTVVTREMAESQMRLLARVHGTFYAGNRAHSMISTLPTTEQVVENASVWFNLEQSCVKGFLAAEEVVPPRLYRRHAEIWPAMQASTALQGRAPRTLTHNDNHLKNWYRTRERSMGLADWQAVGAGDWGRDIANTLGMSLSIDDRRVWEKDLLRLYLDGLRESGGPALEFGDAWDNYRRHLPSALVWLTLTLTPTTDDPDESIPRFQPEDQTLEFIRRMTAAMDDLDALDFFG
jgi:hypothetical protein